MGWGSEFPEPSEAFRHVSILNVCHAETNLGVGLREPWGFAGLLCVFPRASCTLRFFADARTVQPRVYTLMEEMRPRRFYSTLSSNLSISRHSIETLPGRD